MAKFVNLKVDFLVSRKCSNSCQLSYEPTTAHLFQKLGHLIRVFNFCVLANSEFEVHDLESETLH